MFRLPKTPAAAVSRHKLPEGLPTTSDTTPPSTCNRLTVMSSTDFDKMRSKMSEYLDGFAQVSFISTPDIATLYENISKVSPDKDLAVLIHVGASEAAEIAAKSGLSDLEKGAESDREADAICDLAEDLIKRIPYVKVFVSMLCPRFDLGADGTGGGMKLPNSVRRFMNVQLSTRLGNMKRDGKNILLVNNDEVLDCFEDDSKRERLFGARGDGVKLTEEGEGVLVDHWIEALKPVMPTAAADNSDSVESISKDLNDVKVVDDKFEDAVEVPPANDEKDDKSNEAVSDSEDSSSKAEIREKENDEKMEKELWILTKHNCILRS